MNPIQIGFLGFGWRAKGYVKAMEQRPDLVRIAGIYIRNKSKAEEEEQKYPGMVDTDLENFLERKMDFVLLAVPRNCALDYLKRLSDKNIPVLCETPPGANVEELIECWRLKEKKGAKIQVAEQYFLQPYHGACQKMVESGMLGNVNNLSISMIHDYHGISMMRRYLGVGFESCNIRGRSFTFPVRGNCDRGGLYQDREEEIQDVRKRADFVFESGKVGFYDFSGEQYFNYYRSRHIRIQGTCGEICDNQTVYLGEDGFPVMGQLIREDLGRDSNLEGFSLRRITMNGKELYRSPFADQPFARLSDDEIAMLNLLTRMKEYLEGKGEAYALEEALQDTYLTFLMNESIRTGKEVRAERMPWAKI